MNSVQDESSTAVKYFDKSIQYCVENLLFFSFNQNVSIKKKISKHKVLKI